MGLTPKVLFIIDHSVKEGADAGRASCRGACSSSRSTRRAAPSTPAGRRTWTWSPSPRPTMPLIEDVLAAPWITQDLEQVALAHASTHLVPEHFDEVRTRRETSVDKTLAAVHERLVKEINFWSDRYIKLRTTSPPARTCG
jgi:hypothetical protein